MKAGSRLWLAALVFGLTSLVAATDARAQAHPDAGAGSGSNSKMKIDPRALQPLEQAQPVESPAEANRIMLDVTVTDQKGKPVAGLQPQDFTVLDDGRTQTLSDFYAVDHAFDGTAALHSANESTTVLIVIDTVNSSLTDVAYARDQVASYLKQDGGRLRYPVALFSFNRNGADPISTISQDGNALADALKKTAPNLHPIRRSEGFNGAVERLTFSLNTMTSIANAAAAQRGRKLLFWISPGWPMLMDSQSYSPPSSLDTIFSWIVSMSTDLRRAKMVLYSLDSVRTPGADFFQENAYKQYLKGVPDANKAVAADLALQVLATQSGGAVIDNGNSSKEIWQEIAATVTSAGTYYSFAFDRPPARHADEYHALKVTVDKPGLLVQTRSGYYDEP